MKVTIPSTTVKSRFLKSLPIGTVYKDPRNNHVYRVEEKRINEGLSKVGIAYFGADEPIEVDVPEKYMKLDNPKKVNIMATMKAKLCQLELINSQLMEKLYSKTKYDQIKQLLGTKKMFETEKELFCLGNECIVYDLKKNGVSDRNELEKQLKESMETVWKNPDELNRLMHKQPRIQDKLLQLLLRNHSSSTKMDSSSSK